MGVEKSQFQHRGHQDLVEMGGAEIDIAFLRQGGWEQRRRQDSPAHADPRRKGLGKGPRMNDRIALGVERPQARHVVAPVAKFAIRCVFDQVDLSPTGPTLGQFDHAGAAHRRHIHAAGIVVIGHRVNRLYPRQLAARSPAVPIRPRWPRGSGHPDRSPRRRSAHQDCLKSPYRRNTLVPHRSRYRPGPEGYR